MEFSLWSSTEYGRAAVVSADQLLLLLSLLSFLFILHLRSRPPPHKLKLPPSPFPSLPILGDILHIHKLRSSPEALRDKLGPIFTLHAGNTPLICITSPALAHEALVQNGLLFATRPLLPSRAFYTNGYRTIHSAPYGPYWRTVRRNLVQEMLTMSKFISFKPVRFNAMDQTVSRIRRELQQGEGTISVFAFIRTAMFDILLCMCFGFHMPEEAALHVSRVMEEVLVYSAATLRDYYSSLRIFGGKRRQEGVKVRAKQIELFTSHIEKHQELKKQGQLVPGSYLETLLAMDGGVSLSMVDIVLLCSEFLAAGTDTAVTVLEWAMAHVVEDSSIQENLFHEIHGVVGDKPVEEADLPRLPLLQALIKETLRLHSPGKFLLPHSVSDHCKVGGYDIPPNAVVLFHMAIMGRDPQTWPEDPLKFKPERFLCSIVDITGAKEMRMMPFGAGRRICPGIELAMIHMELFVAHLVQAFKWSVSPPGSTVDYAERIGFTVRMKQPLKALVKERTGLCKTQN